MHYTDLTENQLKQCINAEQALQSFRNTALRASTYRGSMSWRTKNGVDYLVKVAPNASQRGMGPRTEDTERIYAEFWSNKRAAEAALVVAKAMVADTERMNKALRAGRCPNVVVAILRAIREANLSDHFMVIGTNALYAYEAQAGVRFEDDITATLDLDFLWDSRKTLSLAATAEIQEEEGLLGVLKKADPTFSLMGDQLYSASNASGYIVDIIKRRPKSLFDDKEPQQLLPNENDFWAVKLNNMDWLLSAPKFKQVVIGINGKFAEMVAPDPRAFVLFKAWMSELAMREAKKKPRDLKQAKAVAQLVGDRMPQLPFDRLHVFPEALRRPFGGDPGQPEPSQGHPNPKKRSAP